jgi:hypothetical protein
MCSAPATNKAFEVIMHAVLLTDLVGGHALCTTVWLQKSLRIN